MYLLNEFAERLRTEGKARCHLLVHAVLSGATALNSYECLRTKQESVFLIVLASQVQVPSTQP